MSIETIDPERDPTKAALVARALAEGGFDDFIMVKPETAQEILTDERRRIVRELEERDYDSVRALARELGRDKGAVSRDLSVLASHDLVEFEERGRGKAPLLKHSTVIAEPIV
jgi:DNA-binding transcriptional ArsR family regulator